MSSKFPIIAASTALATRDLISLDFGAPTSTALPKEVGYSPIKLADSWSDLEARIVDLQIPPAPSSFFRARRNVKEELFDVTSAVKILTANVAMHLNSEWRSKLFKQIDMLHDPEEWTSEDFPIRQDSFMTFLKAIVLVKPARGPGLGLSNSGSLIASWSVDQDHLTIEFLPADRVRWVMSRKRDGDSERFAGQTHVARLLDGLNHLQPERWFGNAE